MAIKHKQSASIVATNTADVQQERWWRAVTVRDTSELFMYTGMAVLLLALFTCCFFSVVYLVRFVLGARGVGRQTDAVPHLRTDVSFTTLDAFQAEAEMLPDLPEHLQTSPGSLNCLPEPPEEDNGPTVVVVLMPDASVSLGQAAAPATANAPPASASMKAFDEAVGVVESSGDGATSTSEDPGRQSVAPDANASEPEDSAAHQQVRAGGVPDASASQPEESAVGVPDASTSQAEQSDAGLPDQSGEGAARSSGASEHFDDVGSPNTHIPAQGDADSSH